MLKITQKLLERELENWFKKSIGRLKADDRLNSCSFRLDKKQEYIIDIYLAKNKITGHTQKADVRAYSESVEYPATLEVTRKGVRFIAHHKLGEDLIFVLAEFNNDLFEETDSYYDR